MIPTIIISLITFIGITLSILFFPHIRIKKIQIDTYWVIALIGAIALVTFSFSPIKEIGDQLTNEGSINPLKILALFFSMTFISIFLDEVGLFRYLAKVATRRSKKNQFSLFFIMYSLVSILTVFTSNDIVILTLTPFICFFCKNAKINPLPYLIGEFAAANTWSMMFIIGNPTNIYLATSAGIDFIGYLKVMFFPTVISGFVEMGVIFLLFFKQLKTPITPIQDDFVIESVVDLDVGIAHLIICLVFLILSSYINIPMWLISLGCAVSLLLSIIVVRLITRKHWNYLLDSFKRLPYQLIPFVLSMFVIVVGLNYQGISAKIGELLSKGNTIWLYGPVSYLASNIINNIPMSILFSNLPNGLDQANYIRAIYSTIIGSNVGAFLTPIGALAGIMFSNLVNKHEIKLSFLNFIKYGAIISIPVLLTALLVLSTII